MEIKKVVDKATVTAFLDLPRKLYKDDSHWVCPLDRSVEKLFDPETNDLLKEGEAERWILLDPNSQVIGRVSAFHRGERDKKQKTPAAGLGHFECIDDPKAAEILFDTAVNWARERGFAAIDGPINFGENNTHWGLLVEGFTQPGYGMNYHHAYYRSFFENYGFNLYFRQFSYHLDMTKEFPPRFWKIAEWVCKKPGYSFEHFKWSQSEKYIRDLAEVYDLAWADFKEDHSPLDPEKIRAGMEEAKPIIDEEMVWFAYYEGKPIAFYIMFPDANQILKHLNGKLHWWNKLKFYWLKKSGAMTRARAQAAGVIPKFQKSGIESGIFWQLKHVMERKPHITEVELSWVGDFNPRMISLYEAVGGKHAKTHHTYRYMIDPSVPFERFMPEKLEGENGSGG